MILGHLRTAGLLGLIRRDPQLRVEPEDERRDGLRRRDGEGGQLLREALPVDSQVDGAAHPGVEPG